MRADLVEEEASESQRPALMLTVTIAFNSLYWVILQVKRTPSPSYKLCKIKIIFSLWKQGFHFFGELLMRCVVWWARNQTIAAIDLGSRLSCWRGGTWRDWGRMARVTLPEQRSHFKHQSRREHCVDIRGINMTRQKGRLLGLRRDAVYKTCRPTPFPMVLSHLSAGISKWAKR